MRQCERCSQETTGMNMFLCKGMMVCTSCYMQATDNNTIFIDEAKYPRMIDSFGNIMKTV